MMECGRSLDFIMSFCRNIPAHGEDSFCYSFCDSAGLLGVFDGCGGSGARKRECYSNKTEAYMASRLCAGTFYDCFRTVFPCTDPAMQLAEKTFKPMLEHRLKKYQPVQNSGQIEITGSMVKTLPSTAAVALIRSDADDCTYVDIVWAGDSRVYIMDAGGLAQLTTDDTSPPDPMQNLYEDGRMNNLICSNKPVKLNCRTIPVEGPFAIFAATDGCYDYLATPMEFEGILLETLKNASCVAEWESALAELLDAIAGDDHTLCMAGFGYGSFSTFQKSFAKRHEALKRDFLIPLRNMPAEDFQGRFELWHRYKGHYFRYIKGEQT